MRRCEPQTHHSSTSFCILPSRNAVFADETVAQIAPLLQDDLATQHGRATSQAYHPSADFVSNSPAISWPFSYRPRRCRANRCPYLLSTGNKEFNPEHFEGKQDLQTKVMVALFGLFAEVENGPKKKDQCSLFCHRSGGHNQTLFSCLTQSRRRHNFVLACHLQLR
jgi:hypothetical protein